MGCGKAAILQKPGLPSAFGRGRRRLFKFLSQSRFCTVGECVDCAVQRFADRRVSHSPRAQLLLDTERTVTTPRLALCVRTGESAVALQTLLMQTGKCVSDFRTVAAARSEFVLKLGATVLAPSKGLQRQFFRAEASRRLQASVSSSASTTAVSSGLDVGMASARILDSSSAARSGLSLRYRRTFSLP